MTAAKKPQAAFARKKLREVAYVVLGAVLFIAAWWIGAAAYGKALIFPTPVEAVKTLGDELTSGLFWRGFAGSLGRSLLSFCTAVSAALLSAWAAQAWRPLRRILTPIVGILRSVPTMSVILLLVLWTNGDVTPVVVAGLVIFPVLYSGIDAPLCALPAELRETAKLYGGGATHTFFRVELPLSAPAFLRVAGGAAGLTLKLTVAAEVLAQTRDSLGLFMQQTRIYFQVGRLMALTVAVVIAALALEFIVYLVRRAVEYDA